LRERAKLGEIVADRLVFRKFASILPASEMSRVSTPTPAAPAYACTIGSSE
jgi:hypothetical protein